MTGDAPSTAMVLAAGRGLRMRPLTKARAKPALPVLGVSLLARVLRELEAHGVRRFAVNAHHQPDSIERAVEEAGVKGAATVFREENLMGPGGSLAAPKAMLAQGSHFVLANADTLCRPPIDLMAGALEESEADGVLLVRRPARPGYRPLVVRKGLVLGLEATEAGGEDRATYLGVAVLSQAVLDRVPDDRPSALFDVLAPSIAGRRLRFVEHRGPWLEMTSPGDYRRALVRLVLSARNAGAVDLPGGDARIAPTAGGAVFLGEGAEVHPSAELRGGVVVEKGARIGAGAVLEDAVVLEEAVVEPLSSIERAVVTEREVVKQGGILRDAVFAGGEAVPSGAAAVDGNV